LIEQLKKKNVLVGRLFPSLPNHLRVTIGTSAEMAAFIERFKEVLKPVAPVGAAVRGRS
jgi:histidinol-phosphate/aromatic aminotransferase/cobyric acid decarboxylase-like protein